MLNPPFKTHGQSDPKSQTEGTSGPTKWTSVQPKTKKLVCYLQCYHKALTLHDEARAKDALNLLQRMFELREDTVKEDDPTEKWLEEIYFGN